MTKEDTPELDEPSSGGAEAPPVVFDVVAVARLAWIALSDEELARYGAQLEHVLDHVRRLDELEDELEEGVEAVAEDPPPRLVNVLRPDQPRRGTASSVGALALESSVGALALESAHARDGDFFVTPRVLE